MTSPFDWKSVEEQRPPEGELLIGKDSQNNIYPFYYRDLGEQFKLFLDNNSAELPTPKYWDYMGINASVCKPLE